MGENGQAAARVVHSGRPPLPGQPVVTFVTAGGLSGLAPWRPAKQGWYREGVALSSLRGWERFDFGSNQHQPRVGGHHGGYMTEHLALLETEAKSALEAAADESALSGLASRLPGP